MTVEIHPYSRLLKNTDSERSFEWRFKVSEAHKRLHEKDKGICRKCKNPITEAEAMPWTLKKGQWECRQCERVRSLKKRQRYKQELVDAYGGKCVCCGETTIEFLTIDHTNGNGKMHRDSYKQKTGNFLNYHNWLKRNGYPKDGFQLMCYNCNCAKGKNRTCPHELARRKIS